jgi:drug/metabolite transporter (DMT)-like permease
MTDERSGDSSTSPMFGRGVLFGLLSSVGYTAANIFLRHVSDINPVWVCFVKSLPTIALTIPWLILATYRGSVRLPGRSAFAMLIGGGVAGQVGGNFCFQWSLDIVGLALAVPLTTGSLIIAGAILARVFLGETISRRNLIANAILIIAVCVLSLGAGDAFEKIHQTTDGDWTLIVLGVIAACVPGIGYSLQNIILRRVLTNGNHMSAALLTISTTGALIAFFWLQVTVGFRAIVFQTDGTALVVMFCAGICNAAAFVALSAALRWTPIWFVYALSSTQLTLAAVFGVWLFHEPLSQTLIIGSALTIVGLAVMQTKKKKKSTKQVTESIQRNVEAQ